MSIVYKGQHEARRRDTISLSAGETSEWFFVSSQGASIVCAPGAGGALRAQFSQDDAQVIKTDNTQGSSKAIAVDWPLGSVTTIQSIEVARVTAVRFIATGQAGVAQISE